MSDDEWLTTGEAAKEVGVHPDTVRRWCVEGLLNYTRVRTQRRIRRDDWEAFKEAECQEHATRETPAVPRGT